MQNCPSMCRLPLWILSVCISKGLQHQRSDTHKRSISFLNKAEFILILVEIMQLNFIHKSKGIYPKASYDFCVHLK